jgi:hypothetical protein
VLSRVLCLLLLLLIQVMANRLWSKLSRCVHYNEDAQGRHRSGNTHSRAVQETLRKQQQDVSIWK